MSKAQVAMEYLMITGLIFLMLIPTIILFLTQSRNFNEDITDSQVHKILETVVGAADTVYYQGPPAQQQLRLYMPKQVNNIAIENQTITFNISKGTVEYTMDKTSKANLTGSLSTEAGLHIITVTAQLDNVLIQES